MAAPSPKNNKELHSRNLHQHHRHEHRHWLLVRQIVELLAEDNDITLLLHVLLAIAASFEFSITEEERVYFFEVHPLSPSFLKTPSQPAEPS